MRSPALGIAYSLWLRLRWYLAAVYVLLPALAITALLFPSAAPYCQVGSVIAIFTAFIPILNACTFGPADLGVRGSGFPTHMLVLPLSNRSLVGWPMLFGAALFGSMWILLAALIIIPSGLNLPVVWPATLIVAVCLWVQAIGWSPFPSPFLRVPFLVLAICPLVIIPLWLGSELPDYVLPILMGFTVTWSLVAFLFAMRGIARARAGSEGDWLRIVINHVGTAFRSKSAISHLANRPFQSAAAAQFWHECRRNAIVLPVMLFFIGVPVLAVMCLSVVSREQNPGIAVGTFQVTPQMLALMFCLGMPLLLSAVSGAGMAKFDVWGKDPMASFFAIRPLNTLQFVRIKVAAAMLSTLVTWGVTLAMFVIWAAVDASPLNPRESMIQAAWAQATPRTVAMLVVFLMGLLAYTGRYILVGMWIGLIGRKSVSTAVVFGGMLLFGGAALAGVWVYRHPEIRGYLLAFLPWALACLLAAKLCSAVAVGIALRKWDILTAKELSTFGLAWFLIAGLVVGAVCCFVSPTWTLVAGLALLVPFSRLAVMPLALHWNRHR